MTNRPVNRYEIEEKLWEEGFRRVMGLDEVGRGCLSGPVVAAGVILAPGAEKNLEIRDSKKIGSKKRVMLAREIKEKALFWTIQTCSPGDIDRLNILKASIRAMFKCVEMNGAEPDYLLVDGNRFAPSVLPYYCVIQGDEKSASIGAASILAKVYRDHLMQELHQEYPFYGWNKNVGYPTRLHFDGLQKHGISRHHRRSFNLRTNKLLAEQEKKSDHL